MASEFRRLIAYERAAALADELYDLVQRWPSFARWSLGVQLMRAADSIGANIAEGVGRWHRADQKRFLLMARGSLYETEHWLLRAESRELLTSSPRQSLDETARALNGLIKKWPPN